MKRQNQKNSFINLESKADVVGELSKTKLINSLSLASCRLGFWVLDTNTKIYSFIGSGHIADPIQGAGSKWVDEASVDIGKTESFIDNNSIDYSLINPDGGLLGNTLTKSYTIVTNDSTIDIDRPILSTGEIPTTSESITIVLGNSEMVIKGKYKGLVSGFYIIEPSINDGLVHIGDAGSTIYYQDIDGKVVLIGIVNGLVTLSSVEYIYFTPIPEFPSNLVPYTKTTGTTTPITKRNIDVIFKLSSC